MQQSTTLGATPGLSYRATVRAVFVLVWRASPGYFLSLLILTILAGIVPLALIFVSSVLIDTLIQAVHTSSSTNIPPTVLTLLVSIGGLGALDQVLGRVRAGVERLYQTRVKNHIQLQLVNHAAQLDLTFFEQPAFHDLLRNATMEASYRPVAMVTQIMTVLSRIVTLGSLAVVLVAWKIWVVPLVVMAVLAMFVVSVRFGNANARLVMGRTAESRKAQYLQMVLTSDTFAKDLRLFGLQTFFLTRLERLLSTMYAEDRRLVGRQTCIAGLMETSLALVRPLIIGYAAFQALAQAISVGQFNLYVQSVVQLHTGCLSLVGMLAQLHEHNLFIANLFRFLALQPQMEASVISPSVSAPPTAPHIEFQQVSFTYPGASTPVLQQVSFQLAAGEAIALVGANGAGKTTLIKLLTGLYQPTDGRILLNGVDIATIPRQDLRRTVSVIFQDYPIFHFSVGENIGVGDVARIDDSRAITAAAMRSGLAPLIDTFPEGYQTLLGRWFERGHELSGGQRQLVALTRALMRQAPILILDEPSAALDIHAEQHFFSQLLDEHRERHQSVIFISHRFATVRRAERILVLEHGRVSEQGTHDELMALGQAYATMFTLQAAQYANPPVDPVHIAADQYQRPVLV